MAMLEAAAMDEEDMMVPVLAVPLTREACGMTMKSGEPVTMAFDRDATRVVRAAAAAAAVWEERAVRADEKRDITVVAKRI